MTIEVREFTVADYEEAVALWHTAEGVVLQDTERREAFERYLERNPGLSYVARDSGQLVGAVLCGTDGRRGYLYHLAVAASHHRQGIGRRLVERCLEALAGKGIVKCHLFVLPENVGARAFWRRLGWIERTDILLMSRTETGTPDRERR